MKRWDAFISHAREDKEAVALPLAASLRRAGVRVWLDRSELRIGDSLREKIDEGLAESRFGIVVLSPAFLAKGWPRRELNGLFALEEDGRKVILPVWHEIDRPALLSYSPILADRLGADTREGLGPVSANLLVAILDPDSGSPSADAPGLSLRLRALLDGAPRPADVAGFLAAHPDIVRTAVRANEDASLLWRADLPEGMVPDLAVGELWRTTGRLSWEFLVFLDPAANAVDDDGRTSTALVEALADLARWRSWVGANRGPAAVRFRDIALDFPCTVVVGRRDDGRPDRQRAIAQLNDTLIGVRIRSYDWLAEAAAQLDMVRKR